MEVLDRLPEAAKNSVFARLAEIADVGSLSREERMKYDYALKKYRDTYAVLDYAKKVAAEEGREEGMAKGRAEGLAEGMVQGRAEGRASIIQCMLAKGKTVEEISEFTDMTVEEVRSLLK